MADYTQATDFSAKDALASDNPSKKILGSDVDAELALISTAIASKAELATAETVTADWIFSEEVTFQKEVTFKQGSDVASANSMTLGDGTYFDITGTTTINTIGTKGIGTRIVLHFDGALQLTHSSDLVLPSGANITTAAGDIAEFYEYASGDWRCVSYTKASGAAVVGTNFTTDGASIAFGADSEITLTHAPDDGLLLKHVGTGDGKEPSLTFQAGDNDIAVNDVLGSIFFQAPDEGAGSDAILVAAGIEAVSEGNFSATNNATKLSFKTGASEAATEKMSLSSAGILTIQGEGSNTTNATQGVLKFWANLSGAGTPALDDSFNCASVTDNGSGDRSIVIANDMASANYASLAAMPADGNTNGNRGAGGYQISAQAAGSSRYVCMSGSTGSGDGLVSDSFTTEGIGGAGDLS